MAIVYSYPKVTSPLATDVLVLTDTTVTAGKRKNKTKSIAMSDVATYIINSKSGITGSGTVNKFPIFTAATVVGDSIITQSALGQGITVGGSFDVTDDTTLQGSLLADSLEVSNDSVFTGSARFNSTIKDTSGGVGTNGQVLTSTGTGVAWATDAGGSVTGTGTTNYIAKWNTSSSIQDSIIFDNGTNVGIGTASPTSKLDVSGRVDFSNDLRLRGTDSAANQGIVRFSVDNNNKLFIDPANDGSNRFVINSNGNVGIGTTFPTEKLDIYSDGNAVVRLESAGGGVGVLDVGTDFTINNTINTNLIFKTSNAERMRITNNGSVGINTSSPNERLSLKNNGDIGISLENAADTSGNYWKLWQDNWNGSSNFTFNINYGGTDFLTATTAGNVGIGTTSPQAKLHVNGSEFLVTQGNETGLNINNDTYIYKIGDISGGENQAYMQIDSAASKAFFLNSNVGIGTTNPSRTLDVQGDAQILSTGSTGLRIVGGVNSEVYMIFGDANDNSMAGFAYNNNTNSLSVDVNNSERMRIDSSGNVGIGTTSPSQRTVISGPNVLPSLNTTIASSASLLVSNSDTAYGTYFATNSSGVGLIQQRRNESAVYYNLSLQPYGGNVGIGNTSPSDNLEIGTNGSADTAFRMYSDQSGKYFRINSGGNFTALRTTGDQNLIIESSGTSGYVTFQAGNSEKMRINYNGNVGIGTTSPTVKLDVNGEIAIRGGEGADDARMYFRASDQSNRFTIETDFDGSSTNDILGFRSVNTDNILTLKGNGNVGIGTISPASKLEVDGGDIEVDDSASGLILRSPNGTRYRIQVDNSGNLTTTAV